MPHREKYSMARNNTVLFTGQLHPFLSGCEHQ